MRIWKENGREWPLAFTLEMGQRIAAGTKATAGEEVDVADVEQLLRLPDRLELGGLALWYAIEPIAAATPWRSLLGARPAPPASEAGRPAWSVLNVGWELDAAGEVVLDAELAARATVDDRRRAWSAQVTGDDLFAGLEVLGEAIADWLPLPRRSIYSAAVERNQKLRAQAAAAAETFLARPELNQLIEAGLHQLTEELRDTLTSLRTRPQSAAG